MSERHQAYWMIVVGLLIALVGYVAVIQVENTLPGMLLALGGLLIGNGGFLKFSRWQRQQWEGRRGNNN